MSGVGADKSGHNVVHYVQRSLGTRLARGLPKATVGAFRDGGFRKPRAGRALRRKPVFCEVPSAATFRPRRLRVPAEGEASSQVIARQFSTPVDLWRFRLKRGILAIMTSQARKILEEALALPEEDRVYLVEALQESIEPVESQEDVDAAWREEITKRVRSIKDGTAVLHKLEDVERELSQILEEG